MGAAAGMALTSTGLSAGLAGGIAMSPVLLVIVALFGVASGTILLVQRVRPRRTAALRAS